MKDKEVVSLEAGVSVNLSALWDYVTALPPELRASLGVLTGLLLSYLLVEEGGKAERK